MSSLIFEYFGLFVFIDPIDQFWTFILHLFFVLYDFNKIL